MSAVETGEGVGVGVADVILGGEVGAGFGFIPSASVVSIASATGTSEDWLSNDEQATGVTTKRRTKDRIIRLFIGIFLKL